MPPAIGAVLLNTHYLSLLVYSWLGVLSTLWAHSGYEIPEESSAHDKHHEFFNCNFGHLGWLDWLHGTGTPVSKTQTARVAAAAKRAGVKKD
eukprot:CAMPEP_0185775646 /NCGR_PEP_ID=MMETSP1174-20130828/82786_1 /TAXON_ID=35687 /ORGANISM="Dictyocha speculum, Strain CCMP1381" /LENGTH=91 /DNA_ID=CAMNT_0028463293 /DNA_START=279 /DNA_END=554 /DNA_ORIENTATION=+